MQADVIGQLRERFAAPLSGYEQRRVVFWHDSQGSFQQQFEELSAADLQAERTLHLLRLEDGKLFSAKRAIYRKFAEDDFLVYTQNPKDFSPHALEGNWLADLELASEHFQADYASMLMDELGASDGALEGIEAFPKFFNAQVRKDKFRQLVPNATTKQDVILGIIASLLGAPDLTAESLVRTYVVSLRRGQGPLETLGKFSADAPFAAFVEKRLGFCGDLSSDTSLAVHIMLTAASAQLPEKALDGLEDWTSLPHGQVCLNVVHAWMADGSSADELYSLTREVEEYCGLRKRFSKLNVGSLAELDVFPCVNEIILSELFSSLANGADRTDEASAIAHRRKDLRWFSRVDPYYQALDAAIDTQAFYRSHSQGFHLAVPSEIWKAYTTDWFAMDQAYRRFCQAVDACQKAPGEVPGSLDDSLEDLASWVERVYVNWFLKETNSCWVNASEKAWESMGYVEGVPRQRRFFSESVVAGSSGYKKTLVIVSDALRFEVASELGQRLEQETSGTTVLSSMQGVFPSITEFGMAALLPHNSMEFSEKDDGVYLDGGKPTASTANRQAILAAAKPGSKCIQAKDLMGAKRAERKPMVADAEYVYVYHNKIDTIGEDYNTEREVFSACDDAISDIVALVKIAVNDLYFTRIIITADHGFLYTRNPLRESDKVSKGDVGAEVVKQGRRYVISSEFNFENAIFIKMNMDDLGGGTYTGLAPRDCIRIKKAGPGDNYVHGGVSLQECCVPVIQFQNRRVGSKGFEEREYAEFKLLSTARRITSMLFRVELFQKAPAVGKVLPCEYELVITDQQGENVSEVRKAHADMTTMDESARVSKVQLSLVAGRRYDPKATYSLVCRRKDTGIVAWSEDFQIDIPFVPMDDFGF